MRILRHLIAILLALMFISLCASGRVPRRTTAENCGKPYQGAGAIVRGNYYTRGDHPWNVALMDQRNTPPQFFCGGTLVSLSHVVTGELSSENGKRQKILILDKRKKTCLLFCLFVFL